ncbi:MAG: phosphate acyltransferase, partial [Candidatus Kapabacteria bacterium]|nr:phosphate acyltransferase [Candidatus Kapabacteria bacterium]
MNTDTAAIRIALDVMGGDFAPAHEVEGALLAARHLALITPVEFIFVGRENDIRAAMRKHDFTGVRYSIINADDVVTMEDEPAVAYRTKKTSSLYVATECVKNGLADAVVSAGNTGAVMSFATLMLGRIRGVSRPTIGSFLP